MEKLYLKLNIFLLIFQEYIDKAYFIIIPKKPPLSSVSSKGVGITLGIGPRIYSNNGINDYNTSEYCY